MKKRFRMPRQGMIAALFAASLLTGGSGLALAQSALPLKGTIGEQPASGEIPLTGWQAETSLAIKADEQQPAPRRRPAIPEADPYAPIGIGDGPLRFFPSLTVGAVYSSNINESEDRPEAATGLQLKPGLRLESDWVRHSLEAGLDGTMVRYAGTEDYDTKNLDLFHRLRLDVRRDTVAETNGRYALDEQGGDEATEKTLSGSLGITHDFGAMSASLRGGLTAKWFDDVKLPGGGKQSNDDRDYLEPSMSLRAAYLGDGGAFRPYVEAGYAPRHYRIEHDRYGLKRDSDGYSFAAGVQIAAEPIWSGELGLTYLHRNYKDKALASSDAFGLLGSVTWSPTELTQIVMDAGTSIDETASVNSPATPTYTFGIDLTHELRDNLDLNAGAALEIEDSDDSTDRTYDANLGLSWQFNPSLAWTAGYDLTWFDAGKGGGDYVEHRLSTGMTISR